MSRPVMEIVDAALQDGYEPTAEEIALIIATLSPEEEKWRDRHGMLKREGYELRPRLQPGWKPSWLESGANPLTCEDGDVLPPRPKLVDAIHEATGKTVYIKEVTSDSEELLIAHKLAQEEWISDPRNHCVPVTKIFVDHTDPNMSYIVMPFLRPVDTPPFKSIREIIKFVDQILEGLAFLHEKGIAHRDCVQNNIMMDADKLYPDGFHPVSIDRKPDRTGFAKYTTRTAAKVKYYFIDFGISVHIPENVQSKLVTGSLGRDRDPPELTWQEPDDPTRQKPYDPFKLDIFIIGNMLKREFQEPFSNLDFFAPLITSMTKADPPQRPTAEEALAEWQGIRRSVSTIRKEWRPRPRKEHPVGAFVLDTISLHQFFMFCAKSLVKCTCL